jgi:hypothetical protein
MDELIEIHSDTNMDMNMNMDISNKNESSQLVLSSKSSTDDKKNGIDVHMLEGKVKTAMVKLQEIIVNKKKEEDSLLKLREEVDVIKKDELESLKNSKKILDNRLMKCLDEQTKNIIIARRAYHSINNKYWWSSIFILIFSSVITFIEAVRLIIENTEKRQIKILTYVISITSIFIGILITIITGYIKFNDYQNKLEIISSRLSLLLQYQKKFEVIKFQLSTYSLPNNKENNELVQCRKHNSLTKDILKDFSNSLNKLEEDIQNNELLKYITDKNETRYYREYVDTYIKDMMYNNYIKSLSNYINDEDIEKNNDVLERITKIANKVSSNNKFSRRHKEIIDYGILKEISIQN